MRRCAFLSTDDLSAHVTDDDLALEPFRARGWNVEQVSWRRKQDWKTFDAVVIRTTWDYQDELDAFLDRLASIEQAGVPLANPLATVKWNARKEYLRELGASGVPVVPTLWRRGINRREMETAFAHFRTEEIVVKPLVGASAGDTYRVAGERIADVADELERVFRDRECMLQPFLPVIVDEGELSIFLFGGKFSHSVLKTPKPRDFRVQEEHGGIIVAVEPDPAALQTSLEVLTRLEALPLYARVDLVRDGERFLLMELELIEPALYFRTDPQSATRFADAFVEWIDRT